MAEPYEEVCTQDVVTSDPEASASEPEVCEMPVDTEPTGAAWPETTDPDLFRNYAETCEQDGGGGAGGAPSTGDGAEGASAVGNEDEVCEQTEEDPATETPAQTDEPTETETPEAAEKKKSPSEMTPEEREADKAAKMDEYAKQSPEEKKARWAKNDGKLDKDTWEKIQKLEGNEKKQAMLQAGIDKLDYDDPRREQLEKVQYWMNDKDEVKPGSQGPGNEANLLQRAGRTGKEGEVQLKEGQTRCGEVAGQMMEFTKEKGAPGFGTGGYYGTKGTEGDKNATPGSGDIVHLRDEAKDGKAANDNGHASMFVVSSPDGKQWLTFDGGQGAANGPEQKIALQIRDVKVDKETGETMVSGPDGTGHRAVSRTWDYQKMHEKYLSKPQPTP